MAYCWQGGLAMALGFSACVANTVEGHPLLPEIWIETLLGNLGNLLNFFLLNETGRRGLGIR